MRLLSVYHGVCKLTANGAFGVVGTKHGIAVNTRRELSTFPKRITA